MASDKMTITVSLLDTEFLSAIWNAAIEATLAEIKDLGIPSVASRIAALRMNQDEIGNEMGTGENDGEGGALSA